MPLKTTLHQVLQSKVAGATVHVAEFGKAGSVYAVVVSDSFVGISDDSRQQRVWRILRSAMDHEQLLHVEFLQLVTHAEETDAIRWAGEAQQPAAPAISQAELAELSLTAAPPGWTADDFRSLQPSGGPRQRGPERHTRH